MPYAGTCCAVVADPDGSGVGVCRQDFTMSSRLALIAAALSTLVHHSW